MDAAKTRAERDRRAYDEDRVHEHSHVWHVRFRHILFGPSSQRGERRWGEATKGFVRDGGHVLEIGCGRGEQATAMLEAGADAVLALDVSEVELGYARALERPGLEFRLGDVSDPVEGTFDLIFGRSVLHHVDLREVLARLYRDNLAPGGRMVFMEPWSHPLTLSFHRLVRSAHTPDERPLAPRDLRWMRATFPEIEVHPIDFVSFPAGALSSLVLSSPDNRLMRAADLVDRRLGRRRAFVPFARQGLIAISKPAA